MPIDKDLSKTLKKLNYGVYLETGFFNGESALNAIDLGFKKVISIEINEDYVAKGRLKFHKHISSGKLEIHLGDSKKILEKILKQYDDIKCIFLDAHTQSDDLMISAPLEEELRILKKYNKDVFVIIDDFYQVKSSFKDYKSKLWYHLHSEKALKAMVKNIYGCSTEYPYLYDKTYNSYLINKKIPLNKIYLKKIRTFCGMNFYNLLILIIRDSLKVILNEDIFYRIRNWYKKLNVKG